MRLGLPARRPRASHPVDPGRQSDAVPRGLGQGLAVTGATGAPGRTFLSVNLALGLAALGLRVVLVDADPHLGSVAVQLDLAEDRSLTYLAHEATLRPVDQELLGRHLQHFRGVDVLAGRSTPGTGMEAVMPEPLMGLLRRLYEVVVVDAGALDCPAAQASALACQRLLWVAVPTRLGSDLLDRVLAGPLAGEARVRAGSAVLNHVGPGTLREPESALRRRYGMPVLASVPEDRKACLAAEDSTTPAVLGGALAPPLRLLAQALAGQLREPREGSGAEVGPAPDQVAGGLLPEVMR